MRLHEYEALDIFEQNHIPVPRRELVSDMHEALHAASEIGYPVIVKAQVLVGGRGLAGGIKTAENPEELKEAADKIFMSEIKGMPVRKVLVCQKVDIAKEFYLGMTIDGYSGKPVIMASTEGGVLVEETARTSPDKIAAIHIEPSFGYYPYQARGLLRMLGLDQSLIAPWSDIIGKLYHIATRYEALIAEINPLVVLKNGALMAVDAVLEVDDSALSRIRFPLPDRVDRIENPMERRGREI
ncbi:MAG: ATP-grasp domain-containing protein, partial [Syntrophorhabdaceae bacterium]